MMNLTDSNTAEPYRKLSKYYGIIEETLERNVRKKALNYLNAREGENILEIGFGTGYSLIKIAESVGKTGKVYGIDITRAMSREAKKRVDEKYPNRVYLTVGDARKIPYKPNKFDAVYMAFTLELFDSSEIPIVLKESKRILKKTGRLVVLSMNRKKHKNSKFVNIYEWFQKRFPKYLDCKPIYLLETVNEEGFSIESEKELEILNLCPVKTIVAKF